ncbi:MAG: PEP-CTERM sorting domain-containing protein [Desulfurivibrio sp.]|nr:MAG: PEP-CTERM sorting domain-containing protein [Desulfurivibrio sp.]
MKNLKMIFASLVIVLFSSVPVFAYTVYVGIDHTFSDYSLIDGFQLDVANDVVIDDLDLVVQYSSVADVDGAGFPGVVPADSWEIVKTSSGVYGYNNWGTEDLSAGVILKLAGNSPFSLVNFSLFCDEQLDGYYPGGFRVRAMNFGDEGKAYAYSASVPLPGTVWLLASGLAGLVVLRRKTR